MTDYFTDLNCEPLGEGQSPNHLLHYIRLFRDYGLFEEIIDDQRQAPPASKDVVKNLPVKNINDENDKCNVCLKKYDKEETATELPCKHYFHSECILPWLDRTNSCPMCRNELPTDDETYEEYKKQKLRSKQREQDIEDLHSSMYG